MKATACVHGVTDDADTPMGFLTEIVLIADL
jgi:hypothetical protein